MWIRIRIYPHYEKRLESGSALRMRSRIHKAKKCRKYLKLELKNITINNKFHTFLGKEIKYQKYKYILNP